MKIDSPDIWKDMEMLTLAEVVQSMLFYTHTTNVNKRQRVENSAEIDVNKFNHMIYTYLYIFCPCGCHHFDITKGA